MMSNANGPGGAPPNLPKFVLSSKGNSHPFQERILQLTEPQKVGRSVGRTKPSQNNLIFDCKVLSRNHAIVWYEHGQFWVQDTKSSNGTFVNNQRLNKGTEDSPPKEIFHEDLIQFGVDVVENQRSGVAVTHGCIIGSVLLYHPDGNEAKPASVAGSVNQISFSSGLPVPAQDLYKLQKYLEEASHREQLLESKLAALQRLVADTRTCSAESWRALVEEDSLLTRLELLETQLMIYTKNLSDDSLQKEINMLNEDKNKYAADAKTSVEKMVKEKQQTEVKLAEVERCYSETEDECEHLRATSEETASRLQELATKHSELLEQINQLKTKLADTEKSRTELADSYIAEKVSLLREIEKLGSNEQQLNSRIASLEKQLAHATAGTSLEDEERELSSMNRATAGAAPSVPGPLNSVVAGVEEAGDSVNVNVVGDKSGTDDKVSGVADKPESCADGGQGSNFRHDDLPSAVANEDSESSFQDRCIDEAIKKRDEAEAAARTANLTPLSSPPSQLTTSSRPATSNPSSPPTVLGDVTVMEDVTEVETTKNLGSPSSAGNLLQADYLDSHSSIDSSQDEILDLEEFPLESVFDENAIMLEALQSDIKSYSEQLGVVAQRLTDDTRKELATLKENLSRVVAHMNDLKVNDDEKTNTYEKTIQELQVQLAKNKDSMHSREGELVKTRAMLDESNMQMASKDVEIIALQEQLNSAKVNVDELRSTVTGLNDKIAQCHREKQVECEKLSQQLSATEAALNATASSQGALASATEQSSSFELASVEQAEGPITISNYGDRELLASNLTDSIYDDASLPPRAFQRTPVKFIEKLRRTEAEKDRVTTELNFVQSRLRDNQSQMASALATLDQSVKGLRKASCSTIGGAVESGSNVSIDYQSRSSDSTQKQVTQEEIDAAVSRLQEISAELSSLQSTRQTLATSQSNLVQRVSYNDDSIVLLNKLPVFIIVLAIICAVFKALFPD